MAIFESTVARKPGLLALLMEMVADYRNASAVTGALRLGERPNPANLRALGIDPAQFNAIRRA